ncbi:MAG: ribosome silencing factor [Opitutales bacterium]|nr:ribosome silencing factor [Opitutales bacterium]
MKKAAGTPAKKTCAAKKSPAKKKAPAVKENPSAGIGLVKRCVAALEEKKASAIEVIYLGEKSPVTDYYVIATGTSDPHLRALRIELEKAIHEVVPAGQVRIQNEPNSGWCVVDAFDVVVHIFSEEQRKNYALEELWKDGEKIEL